MVIARWSFRGVVSLVALVAAAGPGFAQGQVGDYGVGAGDEVSIRVFDEPLLSRVALVSPRCRVDVELIGPVDVCGRTTIEIADDVRRRLADGYLASPHVIVEVTTYGSQKIEVRGAVQEPGIFALTGPTLLSQAVTLAGGPVEDNVIEVEVIRADGSATTYPLSSLHRAEPAVRVAGGDMVILRQGRFVYVDGEVEQEGQVPYHEGLTVSQAISLAGGPAKYASNNRVFVLTRGGERVVVKLRRVREGREDDLVLRPDDRVTLPRSIL